MLYVRCRCLCCCRAPLTSSSALPSRSHSRALSTVGLTVWFCVCLCFFFLLVLVLFLFASLFCFIPGSRTFKNITKFIAPALTRIYFLLKPESIINVFFTRFFPLSPLYLHFPSLFSFVCGVILSDDVGEGPPKCPV